MNTRRNTCRRVGEATIGGNQAPPQAPAARVQVSVKRAALTDREVRETLVHRVQSITGQAQAITGQATREVLRRRTHMLAPWLDDGEISPGLILQSTSGLELMRIPSS